MVGKDHGVHFLCRKLPWSRGHGSKVSFRGSLLAFFSAISSSLCSPQLPFFIVSWSAVDKRHHAFVPSISFCRGNWLCGSPARRLPNCLMSKVASVEHVRTARRRAPYESLRTMCHPVEPLQIAHFFRNYRHFRTRIVALLGTLVFTRRIHIAGSPREIPPSYW